MNWKYEIKFENDADRNAAAAYVTQWVTFIKVLFSDKELTLRSSHRLHDNDINLFTNGKHLAFAEYEILQR